MFKNRKVSMKLNFVLRIIKNCSILIWDRFLKPFWNWSKEKANKTVNNIIKSLLSPHVMSILTMTLLTYFFGESVTEKTIDTITHTQAKMLLQKENLNPLQYQMTELWTATQMLIFLFKENDDKIKKNEKPKEIDKRRITKAYKYWDKLRLAWQDDFGKNYKYISELRGDKKERQCRQKKEFLTDLEHKFKCIIQKQFDVDESLFDDLETCYNTYYLKNKSCHEVLPKPSNITELNKKINLFYIEMSEAK